MIKKVAVATGLCILGLLIATMLATRAAIAEASAPTEVAAFTAFTDEPTLSTAAPTLTSFPTSQSCEQIISLALRKMQDGCTDLARNSACYGNDQIRAELQSGSAATFLTPGDRSPIKDIKTLTTSPLDQTTGIWGLSLLKLQANLPDTLPGQNVTFLVYGNTSIQNVDGAMQAFYFSTGLGELTCNKAPPSMILVRSPEKTRVTFTANGVKITIASTVSLRAVPNQAMTIELFEGQATISTEFGTRTLLPGQMTTVKLGGDDGLQPQSAPAPQLNIQTTDAVLRGLSALDTATGTNPPITIRGCISEIDNGNVVIGGYPIAIPEDNPVRNNLAVGNCVVLSGPVSAEGAVGDAFVPSKVAKVATPEASQNDAGGNNGGGNSNNDNDNNGNGGNGNNGNGNNGNGNGNNGNGNGNNGNNNGNNGNNNGNNGNNNGNNGNNNGNNGNDDDDNANANANANNGNGNGNNGNGNGNNGNGNGNNGNGNGNNGNGNGNNGNGNGGNGNNGNGNGGNGSNSGGNSNGNTVYSPT